MYYFDHTASTPLRDKALEILCQSYKQDFANPSAAHALGFQSQLKIMKSRARFLRNTKAFGKYDFFFTSSATESNNSVFFQFYKSSAPLLINPSEHPSMLQPVFNNCCNSRVHPLPLSPTGTITIENCSLDLIKKAELLSFCLVNNQNGIIQDYLRIAKYAKNINPNIHIHIDAVQAFTKFDIQFDNTLIDSVTVAAHKMGGPKGVAGLFWTKNKNFKSFLSGGGQENRLRSSTQNTSLILSFTEAFKEALILSEYEYKIVKELKAYLQNRLLQSFPDTLFPFEQSECSAYILLAIVPGLNNSKTIANLARQQVYLSSSSACSSGKGADNPIFSELGIPKTLAESMFRISLHPSHKKADIDHLVNLLSEERQPNYQENNLSL